MLAPQQEVEVDVRKEDQDRINEFGRNNSRLADLRDELKALKEKLGDANTEIMMGAGDNVQLFGESFVEVSEEDAQEYLEAQTDVSPPTSRFESILSFLTPPALMLYIDMSRRD
ncbi:hypothetical protein AaE_004040 [Aphanomyces astaci]|uniref:Prefoldin subunit 4 n=1 Tax=Aphanomyces astaci TaxID=112090 RepID=A0A6A5AQ39_APHAT|nr:hypothetical protein AaE_004040 [Aphanomyces astaci]